MNLKIRNDKRRPSKEVKEPEKVKEEEEKEVKDQKR